LTFFTGYCKIVSVEVCGVCRENKLKEDFMKKMLVLLAALAIFVMAGCTTVVPVDLTTNAVGSKVGESKARVFSGGQFGGNFDWSIQTAAKNGGITKIATVDKKTTRILGGLIITHVTIVTGE
jgi:hypothetical protein